MKLIKLNILSLLLLIITGHFSLALVGENLNELNTMKKSDKNLNAIPAGMQVATLGGGCFWCVEAIYESVEGVKEVISGYSGGTEENPTYEQVSYGKTSHAEAVEVYYNPNEISYIELVQVFFGSHDPTSLNRQGPDRGAQYRSIAFYKNPEEKKIIESYMAALEESGIYNDPIVTEVTAFTKFYDAEDYHQDYEKKNPDNSYIRQVSIPRLNRFKKNFPGYLKKEVH